MISNHAGKGLCDIMDYSPIIAFTDKHAFFMFCIIWVIMAFSFKTINRLFRSVKVLVRGWPPAHLDADGDFRPLPKDPKDSPADRAKN